MDLILIGQLASIIQLILTLQFSFDTSYLPSLHTFPSLSALNHECKTPLYVMLFLPLRSISLPSNVRYIMLSDGSLHLLLVPLLSAPPSVRFLIHHALFFFFFFFLFSFHSFPPKPSPSLSILTTNFLHNPISSLNSLDFEFAGHN